MYCFYREKAFIYCILKIEWSRAVMNLVDWMVCGRVCPAVQYSSYLHYSLRWLCFFLSLTLSLSPLLTAIKLDLLSLNPNPLSLPFCHSHSLSPIFCLSHSPKVLNYIHYVSLPAAWANHRNDTKWHYPIFIHSPFCYLLSPIFNFHYHFAGIPSLCVSPHAHHLSLYISLPLYLHLFPVHSYRALI